MFEMSENICKYSKFGHCKNGSSCERVHFKDKCSQLSACTDIQNCPKRHPKACKVFALEKFCRFGSKCSYHHFSNINPEKNSENETRISDLEKCVRQLTEKVKTLESHLTMMKSIKDSKSSSSKENEVIEKKAEVYKCDQCKFSSEREITLNKHKNSKHVKHKCDDCGHSFKSAFKLESHKKIDHLKTTQKGKITENESNVDKR
jgi:hypothetical protein